MRRWCLLALLLAGCTSSSPEPAHRAAAPPLSSVAPSPSSAASPGCRRTVTGHHLDLDVDGVRRGVAIALPVGDGRRHPLVVGFHGYAESVADLDTYTGLREVGTSLGAVVAEPAGLGSPPGWNVPDSTDVGPSDVGLTRSLVSTLVQRACVDPARVVLAGISDGADMAVTAACASPGTAAALLLVAASTGPSPRCPATAVLQVHGTADPVDAYTGRGVDTRRGFGSVKAASAERAFALWWALAGCAGRTDATSRDLRRLTGSGCTHPVQLIAVQGGGHTWPGAQPRPRYGSTTASIGTRDLLREALGAIGP